MRHHAGMNTPRGNQSYPPYQQPPQQYPPQPQTPYSQGPYGSPHPPQAPAGPYPQQAPYGTQPPPYGHPPAPHGQARVRVPRPAGEGRRILAVTVDLFAVGCPAYLIIRGEDGRPLTGLLLLLGLSFANQVLLTYLLRASIGKLVTGIRVIRAADGGRPGLWRTVYRWLSGLCWLPLQPYYGVRAFFRGMGGGGPARGTVADNDDGELYHGDLAGLRYARRRDLAG